MTLPEYSPAVYDLLRAYQANGHHQLSTQDEKSTKRFLREEKLLHDYFEPYGYRLTAKGIEALRQEDVRLAAAKKAAEKAEQERSRQQAEADAAKAEERAHLDQQTKQQFRHDWRIAIFELVGGFVVGAVADHFFDIVGNTARTVIAALMALGLLH